MKYILTFFYLCCFQASFLLAEERSFHPGNVIKNFGPIATVEGTEPLPKNASFKVSFDLVKTSAQDEVNRSIESVARFINMHAQQGVPLENMQLAVVVHGGAVKQMQVDASDVNNDLIKALLQQGVDFYVCSQSAAYHQVTTEQLIPGVKMSLSAMTAHALLQQQGYTVNPF